MATPKWKGTWKSSVQHLDFFYNFIDNENLQIKTIAFTMPCKYTCNEDVEPHTIDIHTKDPTGAARKLLGYIQYDDDEDTLILWTPRTPPTSEIDPERPDINECDKMVCRRSKLPELDESVKKLSKRERVLAVLKETATLLNGYKRDGTLSSDDPSMQQKVGFSLMAIPSRFGITPQEVEDISSADPELKAFALKLQSDLTEDMQPSGDQFSIFEEGPEEPKQQEKRSPADRKILESDNKQSNSNAAPASSPSKAVPQSQPELKVKAAAAPVEAEPEEEEQPKQTPQKPKGSGKKESKSSGRKSSGKKQGSRGDSRQTTVIRGTFKDEEEDQTGNTWLKVAGGAVVVGAVAFVALKLRGLASRSS